MRIFLSITIITLLIVPVVLFLNKPQISGAPPFGIRESEIPELNPRGWIESWVKPDGPARVGLQVGHLNNEDFPEELAKLRNNGGASGGGKSEDEVNFAIAEETKKLLEARGVEVDIIPATVPPDYWADAFIAIHADGSTDRRVNGYKIASPWRDFSGDSATLVNYMRETYSEVSGMPWDDNISRNMRGYYAFSWWRFEHSIHPMTTAAIVETGFLTNPENADFLINSPGKSAQGIAEGVIKYLESEKLLEELNKED